MTRWVMAACLFAVALTVAAGDDDRARSKPGMLRSQSDSLAVVVFNHKGDRLACGAYHDDVRLWDPRDWSLVGKIEAKYSLSYMCFSPDDRFLYVADGSTKTASLARYDVRTGKRDQTYEGHKGVARWIVVSPDGKTLVTRGTHDHRTIFWDARSGKILRVNERHRRHALLHPDGSGLLRFDEETGWIRERFREERARRFALPGIPRPTSQSTLAASRDGRWLVVGNAGAEIPFFENPGSLTLYERRDGAYREVARIKEKSPWPFRKLAISPDHRLIAAGGLRNEIRFYSLPALVRVGDVHYPRDRASDYSMTTLAFSPDSRLLALGMGAPVPGLIDLTKFRKLMPWSGHGDKITALSFTADGKSLRSFGRDNVLCIWEAATMKRVARHLLPDGREVVSARPPHGDRLLCVQPDSANAVVVDGTSGKVLFEFTLPAGYRTHDVRWLPGDDVLLVGKGRDRLGWFDCSKGKLTREIEFERQKRIGAVTEDFKQLYAPDPPYRNRLHLGAGRIDLKTGAATRIEPPKADAIPAETTGLVPGGRYFYSAGPDVRIYERTSMKCVAHHRFDAKRFAGMTLSGNGDRFAVVLVGRPRHVIQIHETLSGKEIFSIPNGSYHPRVKLDTAGTRVAIVNDDATIERWTLPG